MDGQGFKFIDRTGAEQEKGKLIPAVLIKKSLIDEEVERLANLSAPQNGRRVSLIACPATGVGDGLTYSTAVSLCVLKPGERTTPVRHNASVIDFCIRGGGHTMIDGKRIDYRQFDVWTTPSWRIYQHFNATDELQVRLNYSNSALLEKLGVYIVDENPKMEEARSEAGTVVSEDPEIGRASCRERV